jgi:hypothetical protein
VLIRSSEDHTVDIIVEGADASEALTMTEVDQSIHPHLFYSKIIDNIK